MWPLGRPAGAARWNPASTPAFSARRGRGDGLQSPGTRFGWLAFPWEWPACSAQVTGGGGLRWQYCGVAGARRGWQGVAREGVGEVYAHKREDRPLISRRRAPDSSSGRTTGPPGAPTAVRRRNAVMPRVRRRTARGARPWGVWPRAGRSP
jgi:hypothetical protein